MKKRFFAMYALVGALVASPIFTSCVDDTESDSVVALRNANTEYKKAQTAQIEANIAISQATAALEQEAKRISNELAAAELAHKKAMNAYEEALKEATNAKAIEEARIALEKALREEEIAKAKAEAELEAAKLAAEDIIKKAQLDHLKAEKSLADYIKGLDAAKKLEANKLNANINAIMNGGWYSVFNGSSWSSDRYYSPSYSSSNDYNSIIALNQGLINEKVNLHNLQNGLIDIEEWMAEEKLDKEEEIAKQEALIAKYTELAKSSNLEAAEKAYKEAEDNLAVIEAGQKEIAFEISNANNALTAYKNGMKTNAIAAAIADLDQKNYLTEKKEREEYKDTIILADNSTLPFSQYYDNVYEHTAENAEDLAAMIAGIQEQIDKKNEEIENLKESIAKQEAELAKVNADELQRLAAIYKAKAEEVQKAIDDVLASEAYKTKVAALEKAVADAQAAFDKNPTSKEPLYNDDGTPKLDADGNQEYKLGTKELLEKAEDELKDVVKDYKYNYGTDAEPKWLDELYDDLYNDSQSEQFEGALYYDEDGDVIFDNWNSYTADGLIEMAKKLADGVEIKKKADEGSLKTNNGDLDTLNTELEGLTKELEKWKEFQATLADSKVWEEYAEMCKAKAELETALYALKAEGKELDNNYDYYDDLKTTLFAFVGDENNAGSLPNYAELIETAEDAIKTAKEAIADLEYNTNNTQSENKLNQEALIAYKEAVIAAIEAEIEIRQAEYDAEMAELKALVGAEEETPAE